MVVLARVIRLLPRLLPCVAVLMCAAAVNGWVARYPARLDLTRHQVYSVSTETIAVLEQLSQAVEVVFFYISPTIRV